jgi:hypothetical protein
MNFRARWSARFAIAAVLFTAPCFAQDPAQDAPVPRGPAAPDYLNPAYFNAACAEQNAPAPSQNAPAQNAPQTPQSDSLPATTPAPEQEPPGGKRVFGVLPNYRTASSCQEGNAISAKNKIKIALKDSFDYPLVLLAAAYAGANQLTNDDPSFGQGVKGYAHRLATNYADQAIGNMMTEGFLPVLFHEDPRYFRRGPSYHPWYRVGYALTRVIVTDTDSGRHQFNYSEWIGNAAAAGISNLYEPDDRQASSNIVKLLEYVGTDAISQVLKEFWPDIKHKFFHRGSADEPCAH